MSSQLQVSGEAKIRAIQGPVVANSGVITALNGGATQYVRGDGTLADFPTSTGGGSSVSYYLNSSVSQGTIGGVAYRQLSKTPVIGAGTDITISANGYVANYITDANDPALLEVPGGNFNCEFYFSVNSNNHNPFVYAELYKYDGTNFTLLGSNQAIPDYLSNGTTLSAYYFAIPVAVAALNITDRLAIRIYVNVDTKTVTLHTENNHLCQVVTTFSKGLISLNNLTRQNQFFATGTSGTDFGISSATATHTFNLPVASAANTGKLSSTDWSTFNNKQNTITDPITGTGASTQIAYFNSGTSITSEAAFNYDASLNRLGVNTSVPNATIGANAALDSGYSLLLKSDNANYNSIGFATDSTYGNMIQADRTGAAPSRNLTLYNFAGFISLTEAGNLGIGLLVPNNGIDIYHATQSQLWLHNAATGVTSTDGVRLALFNNLSANLRNFDGPMSIASEGDFTVLTLGAENIRVNSADGKVGIGAPATVPEMLTVNGSIQQTGVLSALLKTNGSGKIIAAVANTDYQSPISLTTTGSSGAATFSSNILNVPNYTLSGLGGVPSTRTITINGTSQDLSADRTYTVGTMGGSGVIGRVAYYDGVNSITSESGFIYDASSNRLGVDTISPNATIGANSGLDSGYSLLLKNSDTNYNGLGFRIDSTYGHMIETTRTGSAIARNLTLINNGGFFSVSEAGNFGFNILAVNSGVDIYASTNAQLWLHNGANTGSTQGARLAYFSNKSLNLRNFEGPLSLSSEGDFSVITLGAENIRVNSANGYVGIGNPSTLPTMLTVNGGATISNLTTGQIVFPTSGGTLSGSSSLFWDNANAKLGIGTSTLSGARVTITSTSDANHLQLVANAPAMTFIDAISFTRYATVGMATANNNFITGAVLGDLVLGAYNTNNIWFYNANTNTVRMSLNGSGDGTFSGFVSASGPKSQIRVNGNSVGCGISLSNTIVGANRRNWGIFTEQDVEGDFVIKRSNASGGSAESGTTILSLLNTGAATFSSSVTATGVISIQGTNQNYLRLSPSAGGAGFSIGRSLSDNNAQDFFIYDGIANATRLFINSTGNVGIGSPNPAELLDVNGAIKINNYITTRTSGYTSYNLNAYYDVSTWRKGASGYARRIQMGSDIGGSLQYSVSSAGGSAGDAITWSDKLIITDAGNVLIGRTTSGLNNTEGVTISGGSIQLEATSYVMYGNRTTSDGLFMGIRRNNVDVGSITVTTSSTAFNTSSDYRLKQDLKEFNGLSIINSIKTYDYEWKIDNTRAYGVIAHELEEILPYAVFGKKDEINENGNIKPQAVDYSKIVPLLINAIQELKQEIDILKNK
jgi:hypothetical protein